jgi:hypothetical protein
MGQTRRLRKTWGKVTLRKVQATPKQEANEHRRLVDRRPAACIPDAPKILLL